MDNRHHLITRWRIQASPEEIYAILSDLPEYPRWWPSVYLSARPTAAGRVRLRMRGLLPYVLTWEAQTIENKPPGRIAFESFGDLEGVGEWSIVPNHAYTDVTFDWLIEAEKPLLRYFSLVAGPVFEASHRWSMEQGRRSLELEIARYRASTVEEMNRIDPPPRAFDSLRRDVAAGSVLAFTVIAGMFRAPR